ncbi:MAG: hypothetical protein NTV72_02700 [Candidatus Taylorbacteria bacterium]|nr:hypothetical protein [Candidatus Taylorbacteria bacterium]
MEKTNGKTCGFGCCHDGQHNWHYHLLRWVVGIAIIVIVFCAGVKIGELKSSLEGNYGGSYSRHSRSYAQPMMYYYNTDGANYGYGMMRGSPSPVQTGTQTPVQQTQVGTGTKAQK